MRKLPSSLEKILIKYQNRQGRKKADFYLVEGKRCCEEAFRFAVNGIRCVISSDESLLDNLSSPLLPRYQLDQCKFDSLSQTENAQGIMLMVDKPVLQSPVMKDPFLLVLDGLQEPGNMGTILRTALAVGLTEVALTKGTVDPYNPKAVRAGMGAQFRLNITQIGSLSDLASKSLCDGNIWLTTPRGGVSCYEEVFDLRGGVLVFGEEGDGIKDLSLGRKVSIPMPGAAESLNVAQAATLFLFEGVRRGLL